jgi:stearoyl-CoA desaturase (delta-9 desaturase)
MELDIPGREEDLVPLGRERSAAKSQIAYRVVAFTGIYVPPVVTAVALWLAYIGWYRITWFEIACVLVMHLVAITGVEVGFHRLFTHSSYRAHRVVRFVLSIMGSFAFQGPVIWWAATHRRHHRTSDRPGDPHSMYLKGSSPWALAKGFIHAHFSWPLSSVPMRGPAWGSNARDLYRDPDLFRTNGRYHWYLLLGFLLPAAAGLIHYGSLKGAFLGFLWGGFVRVFVHNHLTFWTTNSISHSIGKRPYVTADKSTNSIPILFALPTLGQSWHNNHHAFPSYWRMGHHWWQVDLGTYLLLALHRFGLVTFARVPTEAMKARKLRS